MTRIPLAILFALSCSAASAQVTDSPLTLSYTSSLQSYHPAALDEPGLTVTPGIQDNPLQALPIVELASATPNAGAIDLTSEPGDLFERLRTGFAMPNISNDLVLYQQQWYTNRPDYLRRVVERSGRYMHHIIGELEKRGMPTELALLPMVESAYNPMAYSPSHASGLWQFIPSTGKNYKLEQNWWVDERRDIVASTTAALDYLQAIYEMHGDWHLALASYNWGEGAVGRAIAKNKAKGLPTDYLSLTMPNETRNYVPKLQALKNIFNSPRLLANLGLGPLPNRPYFSTIAKSTNIDVKVAAKLAEMPIEEFVALNPAHNRPVIKAETQMVIPTEKVDTFMANLESHENSDQPLSSWQAYTFRAGDKLEQLAPRFGMTVANLKAINGIKGRIKVTPGYTLLVPMRDGATPATPSDMAALAAQPRLPDADPTPAASAGNHTVRRGETLLSVAKRYGTSVAELKRINRLRGDRVAPGTKLALAAPAAKSEAKTKAKTAAPAPLVAKASSTAKPGKQAPLKLVKQAKKAPKLTRYTIRRGDTLASIARQFKVEKDDLLRWNRVAPNALQPGQTLTIQLAQND